MEDVRLVIGKAWERFKAVAGTGAEAVEPFERGESDGDGGLERGDPHEIGVSHFSGDDLREKLCPAGPGRCGGSIRAYWTGSWAR
jgi:hypothetical protein